MLSSFSAENANDVWSQAAEAIIKAPSAENQQSRSGNTREIMHATMEIFNPRLRWITSRVPAINPAFAIAEIIWAFTSKNNSSFLNYWNSQLPKYAGNNAKYHGAYGYRLIAHFGFNQIQRAYEILKNNPTSRQVVLQIWDAVNDLPLSDGSPRDADIPCNVLSMLKIRDKKLRWTQIVRSNDLFLGVPYNIALFTTIQEVMASWLSIEIGDFFQLSDSLHVYENNLSNISTVKTNHTSACGKSIELTYDESMKLFHLLWLKVEELTSSVTTCSKIVEIAKWPNVPHFFSDYLFIMCAEACRKRKNNKMAMSIADQCDNSDLRVLWNNWALRWVK
jgi:thymidylate synthase